MDLSERHLFARSAILADPWADHEWGLALQKLGTGCAARFQRPCRREEPRTVQPPRFVGVCAGRDRTGEFGAKTRAPTITQSTTSFPSERRIRAKSTNGRGSVAAPAGIRANSRVRGGPWRRPRPAKSKCVAGRSPAASGSRRTEVPGREQAGRVRGKSAGVQALFLF